MPITTTRALYVTVTDRVRQPDVADRSLLDLLLALRRAFAGCTGDTLTPDAFAAAIAGALTAEAPREDLNAWRDEDLDVDLDGGATRAEDADRMLRSQILDLADARAAGTDRDPHRSGGLAVPRRGPGARATGPRWFNWEPAPVLESGLMGTFGGWLPGDGTGRHLVPGATADDSDVAGEPLTAITWADVVAFLEAGQEYE
ncbi:MAG: hypothetical protein ACEQSX_19255 [Baekduiaceae bacterium]